MKINPNRMHLAICTSRNKIPVSLKTVASQEMFLPETISWKQPNYLGLKSQRPYLLFNQDNLPLGEMTRSGPGRTEQVRQRIMCNRQEGGGEFVIN